MLWDFQDGYRFGTDPVDAGIGWDEDHVVVATLNSDPFVLSIRTGEILFAPHGEGPWDFQEAYDDLSQLIPGLMVDLSGERDRERESLWEETALRTHRPTVAELSTGCKGLPLPLALKAAWKFHGWGDRPKYPANVRRVLSPDQVREIHSSDPHLFVDGAPFFEDGARRYAIVLKDGQVRLPDGRKGGHIDDFLERLTYC
jgi:hypothetical protein